MIDRAIDSLNSLCYCMLIISGMYVILVGPHEWIGTSSSSIMVLAAILSIYAIWTRRPSVEFVCIWFVSTGIGVYVGFVWAALLTGEVTLARATVTTMLLTLLVARGLHLWRLVKQINELERRIENHVE